MVDVTEADREAEKEYFREFPNIRLPELFARHREAEHERCNAIVRRAWEADSVETLSTQAAELEALRGEVERLDTKPWAGFNGDIPDFDHPLRCVFESGIDYAVRLLAKELGVDDWSVCDGTEEFDADLGGTMMNIVSAALPADPQGDPIYPSEINAAITQLRARVAALEESEFNRGVLIAVSTLINGWGNSTQSDHLLAMINATPAMVEEMGFDDYDREPLLAALLNQNGEAG